MISNRQKLGLLLIAVLVISAVAAQAAWAEEFHASAEPAVITGELDGVSKDILTIPGALEVACNIAKFEGTEPSSPTPTTTITPTYGSTTAPTGCEDKITATEATVHTNHCAYVYHSATDANGHAEMDIECAGASENEITITLPALGVTLHIPAQSGLKGVHYTPIETAGKKELTLHTTITGLRMKCTGFACVFLGGENITNAGLDGTEVFRGFVDTGSPLGGTAKTTPGATSEAAQVNITKE